MSSIFSDNNEIVLKAIQFFNSCDEKQKIHLITEMAVPGAYTKEELEVIRPFLKAIQVDLSSHSETSIAQRLFELGMDKTYAQLFVKNIKEKAPTNEYHASVINQISDSDFASKFPDVINLAFFEALPDTIIAEKVELSPEQVFSMIGLLRNAILPFVKRELGVTHIIEQCKSMKMSEEKTKEFVNAMQKHQDYFRTQINFLDTSSNVIEIANLRKDVENIKKQNELILRVLKQLLESIKPSTGPGTPDHIK